jgi:hypothetical protein
MKYIDRQSYQDCAVDNVHKLVMSYFGVRSAVPISESLRKEGFCGIQDKDPGEMASRRQRHVPQPLLLVSKLEAKASNEFGTCWDSSTSLLPLWQSQDLV